MTNDALFIQYYKTVVFPMNFVLPEDGDQPKYIGSR